ncbi:chymotrypsin-like protease CTRL-1 [Pecten maximus]|uniref:chymotrypsin-like protease CTRL-1 n=1 Tax=Pecten maximus TaxID=6579 RepID=UPI001458894C|nr:chymotrypsin-like protease CTRL-1 [Pecten maximus]
MTGWWFVISIVIIGIAVSTGTGQRNLREDAEDGNGNIAAIIGGTNATDNAWPWQVSIRYRGRFMCGGTLLNEDTVLTAAHCIFKQQTPDRLRGRFMCGGTLLNEDTVLTAAHCIFKPRAQRFRVLAGDYNRQEAEPHRNEQKIKVKKIRIHRDYNRTTLINDVAILKLLTPVQFGTYIQPIELAKKSMDISQSKCYITGWGMRDKDDKTSSATILQQTAVSVITNEECQKGIRGRITDDMICTEDPDRATCYGDSGGPLQCEIKPGRWVQVGITSWGNLDCLDGPSVYSRISYNRAWITRRM